MRLTVLGCSGSHPSPRAACSSYLVEADGYRLLLDCGNGSMRNLLQRCEPHELDAILVSHRHVDHWADLIGIGVALRFAQRGPGRVPLYGPEELLAPLAAVTGDLDDLLAVCPFTAVAAGEHLELGPLRVSLHAVDHPVTTLGSRIADGSSTLAYSADSGPSPAVVELARDADLLVADCTWRDAPERPRGVHMSGLQAGRAAAQAGARRLLVTHVWPEEDPHALAREAAEVFRGDVLVAADLLEVQL